MWVKFKTPKICIYLEKFLIFTVFFYYRQIKFQNKYKKKLNFVKKKCCVRNRNILGIFILAYTRVNIFPSLAIPTLTVRISTAHKNPPKAAAKQRSKNALPAPAASVKRAESRDEGRKMAESKRSSTTTTSSASTTNSSASSSSKSSRKSKNDLIRSVVGSYLKQRNYMVSVGGGWELFLAVGTGRCSSSLFPLVKGKVFNLEKIFFCVKENNTFSTGVIGRLLFV